MTQENPKGRVPKTVHEADPHPSDEEHYDQIPHPGGAHSEGKDIGPNPSAHDGKPRRRPNNAENT